MAYTPYGGNPQWADINGLNVPVFQQGDFAWTANPTYDPSSSGLEWVQGSGDQGGMVQRDTGTGKQGEWGLTPEAKARLIAGGWDPKNRNNIGFNTASQGGEYIGGMGGLGGNDPNVNPADAMANAIYKNSGTTALNFNYENGVPVAAGGGNWITNSGEINRHALAAFGGVIGAGLAIPAIAGAAGAGAGGAVAGGTGGAELGAGAGLLGDLTPAAGTVGYGATPGIEGVIAGSSAGAGGGGAALEGLGGVEPISTSGFSTAEGGIGSYGAGAETAATQPAWYEQFLPDWKDLLKQGVKQYMGQQSQGGGGGGGAPGGGGFGGGGAGSGNRMIPGTQDVQGTWKPNQLPMGGLMPPGAMNPVTDAADALAQTLAKRKGLYG